MQDKENVDDAEEALTCKAETGSDRRGSSENKEGSENLSKKESSKDGKFAFRRMKQPKKEKSDKNSPSRFQGEGVVFKAKLIGVESVVDARGDKMCQDAMQKLKQNVKNTGPHKRKINVCVSLQGIKIKDEKNANVIYHHPVNLISFISQDITDARAFGYVFGSTEEPHQFIAIKTEKPAFHVVVAIRDLFQTVLNFKQEAIVIAKESKGEKQRIVENGSKIKETGEDKNKLLEEQKAKEENIYFEVLLTEPLKMKEEEVEKEKEIEPMKTVDDLLGLQNELTQLQEGIDQMDTSIAAVAAFTTEAAVIENDPFDTSFVLGPKRDSFPLPIPTPVPLASTVSNNENLQMCSSSNSEDKYAVFNVIDSGPSIFESAPPEVEVSEQNATYDMKEQEEMRKMPPAKPPRTSKASSPDLSVFADLDPLGKDRPYKDKTEFFQDVKNPPKKVLNDLVDPTKETQKTFDVNLRNSSVPFPVDFESNHTPTFPKPALSSSLPNSFYTNSKLSVPSVQNANGECLNNPFEKQEFNNNPVHSKILTSRASEPTFNIAHLQNGNIMPQNVINSTYLGKSPPSSTILGSTQQLTVNTFNHSQIISQNTSSSPIPIPPRQTDFTKDRSFSNGSIGSPYSKSPIPFNSDSPNHSEYYLQNQSDYSPNGLLTRNGTHTPNQYYNGDNLPTISPPTNNSNRHNYSNNANSHNGVSRPRPRPSLSKGSSVPSSGHSNSSHSLSSDSSSDYEAISRENMQSIANVLLTSGHRLRAQSLCFETNNDFPINGDKNIFAKKNDPFADDFFFSLPKKANHLTNTEIPEYV